MARVVSHSKRNLRENKMRALIISTFLLLSSGCAMIDAYLMAKFDPNEYFLVTQIRSVAQTSPQFCDDRQRMNSITDQMYLTATTFKNYTQYIPHNEKTIPLAESLYDEVYNLHTRYQSLEKVGVVYCRIKLNIVEKSAETIQEVIGRKMR